MARRLATSVIKDNRVRWDELKEEIAAGHDVGINGYRAIVGGKATEGAAFKTALCEHYRGRTAEAYELLADYYRPWFAYQLACCAASLSWWSIALRNLGVALK